MATVPRLLVAPMRSSSAPVLLLEGARGVGKTFLAENLLHPEADYVRVDLAVPEVLSAAEANLTDWLASLGTRVVVDEAQLLPGLQLALKRIVDSPGFDGQFILTGSATLPQDELGGAAPLTRRSESFQLRPLTQWELGRGDGSVIDWLFDGEIQPRSADLIGRDELVEICRRGGFPAFVASSRYVSTAEIQRRTPGDIDKTLTDRLLPEERFEASVAKSVFEALMKQPGGILTYEGFARTLGIDRRTVRRYADLLRRLHLIYWIPNLALRGALEDAPARSKVYPVDTTFAAHAAAKRPTGESLSPENLGSLLEALVVGELTASAEWSTCQPSSYYWRSKKQRHEVDVVLVDRAGRRVGVEVKSAAHVGESAIRGLEALRDESPELFHRGFVVYCGDRVHRLADSIWALPLSMLIKPEVLGQMAPSKEVVEVAANPEAEHKVRQAFGVPTLKVSSELSDASLFLSYVHKDDDYLGGGIVQFAKDLVEVYETLTGAPMGLFVDQENIAWGEPWDEKLLDGLEQTAFLLAAVSPRYLRSAQCQRELARFRASAAADRARKVLPLEAVSLSHVDRTDVTSQTLDTYQYVNYENPLDDILDDPDQGGYRRFVKKVAQELVATVRENRDAREKAVNSEVLTVEVPARPIDLMEAMGSIEELGESLVPPMARYAQALESIGQEFQALSLSPSPSLPEAKRALYRLSQRTKEPVDQLNDAVAEISATYAKFDDALGFVVKFADAGSFVELKEQVAETLVEMRSSLNIPDLEQIGASLTMFAMLSSDVRPVADSVGGAATLIRTMQESVGAWIDRLDGGLPS